MSQNCVSVVLMGGARRKYPNPLMTRYNLGNVKITKTKKLKRIRNLLSIALNIAYSPVNDIAIQIGAGTNQSNDTKRNQIQKRLFYSYL